MLLRINQKFLMLGVYQNHECVYVLYADETTINCEDLLDCGGLEALIDCYEVNALCRHNSLTHF